MPFVNVSFDSGRQGSICNEDGFFHLSVPLYYNLDSLTFSHIGYESRSFPIIQRWMKNTLAIFFKKRKS